MRNITSVLDGISRRLGEIDADFVVDADLIGFHDKKKGICSQAEMLRYINRRRLSRKSNIHPALLAYDLIALQGEDICSMPYQDRRKRLLSILGEPKAMPFQGISPAQEDVLMDRGAVDEFLRLAEIGGARALLERDLQAAYRPGIVAEQDFIIKIRGAHKIGGKYSILEPMIEGFRLNASREDADELQGLEKICRE